MSQAKQSIIWDHAVITDHLELDAIQQLIRAQVKYPDRVHIIIDHDTPAGTVEVAARQKLLKQFARANGLHYCYGEGIAYHLLMEQTLQEGQILIGTGKKIGIVGAQGVHGVQLTVEEMVCALESGTLSSDKKPAISERLQLNGTFSYHTQAKDLALFLMQDPAFSGKRLAIFAPQLSAAEKTEIAALTAGSSLQGVVFVRDAAFTPSRELDLQTLKPLALLPDSDRIVPADRVDGIRVNQVFIGGCQGGTIEALRTAAAVWKGMEVSPYIRVMVAPATSQIYAQAIDEGLIDTFMKAHVLVMNQGCSACWAKSQGRCSEGEVFVTTGSYNCKTQASKAGCQIHITSAKNAAIAALTGTLYEY